MPNTTAAEMCSGCIVPVATDTIAPRGANGFYVTGVFQSTATFGASNVTSHGVYDVFLAKYDTAGNLSWVNSAGGDADERTLGVATDAGDNALVAGYFASPTATFGGIVLTNQNPPFTDGFLVKYGAAGNVIWARQFTGGDAESGVAVAVNAAGEVLVAGRFASPTLALGGITLTNHGGVDGFLAKFTSAGNLVWARNDGGTENDLAAALSLDSAGNSYVAGSFAGNANFGGVILTNSGLLGTLDAFAAKFDSTGSLLWARGVGGTGDDSAVAIGADDAGRTFLGGSFESSLLPFSTISLTNLGSADAFLSQMEISQPTLTVKRLQSNVVLSWPAWHLGFNLQSAGVVGANASWSLVSPAPVSFGGQFVVTNSLTPTNRFFRLIHP